MLISFLRVKRLTLYIWIYSIDLHKETRGGVQYLRSENRHSTEIAER